MFEWSKTRLSNTRLVTTWSESQSWFFSKWGFWQSGSGWLPAFFFVHLTGEEPHPKYFGGWCRYLAVWHHVHSARIPLLCTPLYHSLFDTHSSSHLRRRILRWSCHKIGNSCKLTFLLYRKCVEIETQKEHMLECNYHCPHSDEERMLQGTWCTPEIHKAIEKGYRLIQIHEVRDFLQCRKGLF